LSNSEIHGCGIYTKEYIQSGQLIDVAIDENGIITYFGSKINHSWKPNCNLYRMNVKNKVVYYMVAIMDIPPFTEFTANYMNTPDFIKKPNFDWK
jgi:SET domain-containing protein